MSRRRPLLALALFAPGTALGATFSVGGEAMSLGDAMASAQAGDVIVLANGSYGDVVLDRDITLMATSDAAVLGRVEVRGASVSLQDLTMGGLELHDASVAGMRLLVDGAGAETTGVHVSANSSATFSEIEIRDFHRGGVEVVGGSLAMDGAFLHGNRAEHGAAIQVAGGSATISSATFRENAAEVRGGHLAVQDGQLSVTGSRFVGGEAVMGGAVSAQDSVIELSEIGFDSPRAWGDGGAIHVAGGETTLSDVRAASPTAEQGGFASFVGGQVAIEDLDSDSGTAWLGGHLHIADAHVSLTRSWLTAGTAARGGAVAMESGSLAVRNAVWTGSDGREAGGAIYARSGELDLRFAVLAQNVSSLGAAVAIETATATMTGVIAWDNAGSEALLNAGGEMSFTEGLVYGPEVDAAIGAVELAGVSYEEPHFTNAGASDWTLRATSPALDVAVAGEMDLDGTVADMGAFGGGTAWRLPDDDGDGWAYGRDCDDTDPEMHEGASDTWYDAVDANCDGADDFDADGDGFRSAQFGGEDCDDFSDRIFPGADETSGDAWDQDCDGLLDIDADGDGWAEGVDCDDGDSATYPGADDAWYDGVDSDCAGNDDFDADGDGEAAAEAGGDDCDDLDPSISSTGVERADDGIDQDCDGADLADSEEDASSGDDGEGDMVGEAASPGGSAEPNRVGVTLGCTHSGAPNSGGAGLTAVLALAGVMLLRGRRQD